MDQIVAIEIGDDLHSRRQNVIIEPGDHRVQTFQHRGRVCTFAEKDNSFDDVVVVIYYPVGAMSSFSNLSQTNLRVLAQPRQCPQFAAACRFEP